MQQERSEKMIVTGTYRGFNYEFDDSHTIKDIDEVAEFKQAIDEHIEKELYNEANNTNG